MNIFRKIQNTEFLAKLMLWTAVFIAVGYPIQASVPVMLQTLSTPINIFFRFCTLGFSFFCLFIIFFKKEPVKFPSISVPYLIFWVLYLARLFYDLVIVEINCAACKSPMDVFAFAIGQNLIPLLGIMVYSKYWNQKEVYGAVFKTVVVSAILLILLLVVFKKGSELMDFSQRTSLSSDAKEKNSTIGVSNLHLTGSYLLLLTVFNICSFTVKNRFLRFAQFLGVPVGAFLIILSGSRSPVVISLIGLLYIFMTYALNNRRNTLNRFKLLAVSTVIVFSGILLVGLINAKDFVIYQRSLDTIEKLRSGKNADEYRSSVNEASLKQFISSPVLGDKIVSDYDNFYPHNVYMEVLISLGIIGGILYALILVFGVSKFVHNLQSKRRVYLQGLGLLYMYNLFDSWIGNSLWGAPAVWLVPALFIFTPYATQAKPKQPISG